MNEQKANPSVFYQYSPTGALCMCYWIHSNTTQTRSVNSWAFTTPTDTPVAPGFAIIYS